jgi:hypothetical protein
LETLRRSKATRRQVAVGCMRILCQSKDLQDDAVSDPGVEYSEETDYSRIATGAGDETVEIDEELPVQDDVDHNQAVPDAEKPESEKLSEEDEEDNAAPDREPADGSEDEVTCAIRGRRGFETYNISSRVRWLSIREGLRVYLIVRIS